MRACLEHMGITDGVEVHHVADLPARTGLGTSSAFTVGFLLGLYALKNQMRDKQALTAEAIHVERDYCRKPSVRKIRRAAHTADSIVSIFTPMTRSK